MARNMSARHRSAAQLLKESFGNGSNHFSFKAFVKIGATDESLLVANSREATDWKSIAVEMVENLYAAEVNIDDNQPRLAHIVLRPPSTKEGEAYAAAAALSVTSAQNNNLGLASQMFASVGANDPALNSDFSISSNIKSVLPMAPIAAPQFFGCPPGTRPQWDAQRGITICV